MKYKNIIAIITFMIITFSGQGINSSEKKKNSIISIFDVLCLPDEDIIIKAKMERADVVGLRKDIENEELIFYLAEKKIGISRTNKEGEAKIKINAPSIEGIYLIEVKNSNSSRYYSTKSKGIIMVSKADAQFVVCDIDHTIADIKGLALLITEPENVKPLTGSVEALNYISKKFKIIYLTHRDDRFLINTKKWLDLMGFPKGVTIFSDIGNTSFLAEEFKTGKLKELKTKWKNIKYGVGDKITDANSYKNNSIIPLILCKKDNNDNPEDNPCFKNWGEIKKYFENQR